MAAKTQETYHRLRSELVEAMKACVSADNRQLESTVDRHLNMAVSGAPLDSFIGDAASLNSFIVDLTEEATRDLIGFYVRICSQTFVTDSDVDEVMAALLEPAVNYYEAVEDPRALRAELLKVYRSNRYLIPLRLMETLTRDEFDDIGAGYGEQ